MEGEVSWDDLRVFQVVAQELSFTRAALRLHTAQPALSRRVAKLEARLGVRLFERTSRRVALTEGGRALLMRVDQMSTLWAAASADLLALRGVPRPAKLRLASEWIAGLPSLLTALEADGDVAVMHTRAQAYLGVPQLLADELDLVQGFELPTAPLDFTACGVATIVHEPVWVYLPPGHRLAGHGTIDLADLADEEWLGTHVDGAQHAYLVNVCHQAGFEPRVTKVTDSMPAFAGLFATGRWVTMGTPVTSRLLPHTPVPLSGPVDAAGRLPARRCFLAWNRKTVSPPYAEQLTTLFRTWYGDLVRVRQPAYWTHLRTHPERFPELHLACPALSTPALPI